jgi:hypothetical protein
VKKKKREREKKKQNKKQTKQQKKKIVTLFLGNFIRLGPGLDLFSVLPFVDFLSPVFFGLFGLFFKFGVDMSFVVVIVLEFLPSRIARLFSISISNSEGWAERVPLMVIDALV